MGFCNTPDVTCPILAIYQLDLIQVLWVLSCLASSCLVVWFYSFHCHFVLAILHLCLLSFCIHPHHIVHFHLMPSHVAFCHSSCCHEHHGHDLVPPLFQPWHHHFSSFLLLSSANFPSLLMFIFSL